MKEKQFSALIVSTNSLLREGLMCLLREADFNVMSAKSLPYTDVIDSLRRELSVLLVVDASDDFDAAVDQIGPFKLRYPDSRVVVLVGPHQLQTKQMLSAFRSGANAYLTNFQTTAAFINALELVMLGETILPTTMLADLINSQREHSEPGGSRSPRLSARELEIVRYLIQGNANKVIARKMKIADATVKVHVKAILRKMGVANRTQVAIWAMRNGTLTSANHDGLFDEEKPAIQPAPNVGINESPSLRMSALGHKKPPYIVVDGRD